MNKEVSNSMSKENDPHFEIITPICKACRNFLKNSTCIKYGERPKEYKYGKKYDCPYADIDKSNVNYNDIKNKI